MPQFLVPSIIRATTISIATYDFVDKLVAKSLTRMVATNVATIKCDRAHGKLPGEIVYVNSIGDATYNGYRLITAVPTVLSFSFALTHADELETADTAGVIHDPLAKKDRGFYLRVGGTGNVRYALLGNSAVQSAIRSVLTNVATITTKEDHGLQVGNTIHNSGFGDAAYNGAFTVTVVPGPKQFSFALTHANETVADAGGLTDDTIVKSIVADTKFSDPEEIRKVFTLGTAATGLVVGYGYPRK
jgi:hypothetical protein